MENPYRSPEKAPANLPGSKASRFWWRFAIIWMAMIALNCVPIILTWNAFNGDGFEQVGFPFVAFEHGGFSYSRKFYWKSLSADIILAFFVAYFGAYFLRDGCHINFRKH